MNEPLPVQQIMDLAYAAACENRDCWHGHLRSAQDSAQPWIQSKTYAALRDAVVALSQQPTLEPAPEPDAMGIADLWDRHFAGKEWPPLMHERFAFARELLGHPTERSASKPEAAIEDPLPRWLACPFCGSTDTAVKVGKNTFVICAGCDAHGPLMPIPSAAIYAWNDRMPAASGLCE